MVRTKLSGTVLGLVLVLSVGLAHGQIKIDEPALLDFSTMGYVRVIVHIDEGIVGPLQDAGVFLLNPDYSIAAYKFTDQSGETEFLAPMGPYIVRAHKDLDYRDLHIELPGGGAAETLHFLFAYNPDYDRVERMESSSESEMPSEPDCPGVVPVSVMAWTGGFYTMIPGIEVQLLFPAGTPCRSAFTNEYGQATFVVEEGLYQVRCSYGNQVKSRWIYVFCGRSVDPLSFIF
jgi:hypothetical protein